jgi:hypothetical protein
MMSDPLTNSEDEEFIRQMGDNLKSPLIWETSAYMMQRYIKKLVQHEVDVITDSDSFQEQILQAAKKALNED